MTFCNSSFMPVEADEQEDYTVVADSWLAEIRQYPWDFGTQAFKMPSNQSDEDYLESNNDNNKEWTFRLKVLCVVLMVFIALVGNVLVILSVILNKSMRTTMNYYLVNLSMADLMITLWCPAQSLVRELSDHNGYILPAIFCKIGVFYTVLCMVSSVMTLSAISCDRFLAVICPLRTRVTQRKARYFIVSVWVLAALVASPFLFYRKVVEIRSFSGVTTAISCNENFPIRSECDLETSTVIKVQVAKKIYYFFINIVMFFIPILLMTICYSMIVAKLYCSSSPGERLGGVTPQARAKRKVVKLVLVVITTFVLCWSPHQVPMAHAIFSSTQQLPLWLKQNEFWINMFAYSHAMINPIIYITFNANFKKAFKRFLCCSNEFIPNEYSRNYNAKHELNNVGSLSPERTVLRADSRVKVLAKDGIRRESGQASVKRHYSWNRSFSRRKCGSDIFGAEMPFSDQPRQHNLEIRCTSPSLCQKVSLSTCGSGPVTQRLVLETSFTGQAGPRDTAASTSL